MIDKQTTNRCKEQGNKVSCLLPDCDEFDLEIKG